jgi:hypothetical protein
VAWQNVAENRGAWVEWTEAQRLHEYRILREFDGPYVLAGEHMSYINAWQAGALESARRRRAGACTDESRHVAFAGDAPARRQRRDPAIPGIAQVPLKWATTQKQSRDRTSTA